MVVMPMVASGRHAHDLVVSAGSAVPLSTTAAIAGGVIAAVLAFGLWSFSGHVITIAHEGGHAVAALLLGGRILQVRLNPDRSGSTASSAALLQLPVTFAGYVGPSAFGLVGCLLLVHGRADAVLWVSLVLLALLLLTTANWFGRFVLVVVGAALVATLLRGSPDTRVLIACAWVWLLLIGGVLHVWDHRRGGADFAAMRAMTTLVPAGVWAWITVLTSVAALLLGGAWLLGAAAPPF